MPKPVNAPIGTCPCMTPGCTEQAEVKKQRGGSQLLYLVCPSCGVDLRRGQAVQEYILENATLNGPPAPGDEPDPDPDEGAAEPAPQPKKAGGVLDWL